MFRKGANLCVSCILFMNHQNFRKRVISKEWLVEHKLESLLNIVNGMALTDANEKKGKQLPTTNM